MILQVNLKKIVLQNKFWELLVDASVMVTLATGVPQIKQ